MTKRKPDERLSSFATLVDPENVPVPVSAPIGAHLQSIAINPA
ncbi:MULTISPECIES: hypothetical protein [unclassified Rhizobium]|nr:MULTISPECIES: hypothetical protein [unclassified Rhizobium]MBP2463883.1 hypothetical protein [Rhizobium sp. PvP014]MBP2532110.1 hypothetical protein [Rhizobium sp. PvP099]